MHGGKRHVDYLQSIALLLKWIAGVMQYLYGSLLMYFSLLPGLLIFLQVCPYVYMYMWLIFLENFRLLYSFCACLGLCTVFGEIFKPVLLSCNSNRRQSNENETNMKLSHVSAKFDTWNLAVILSLYPYDVVSVV